MSGAQQGQGTRGFEWTSLHQHTFHPVARLLAVRPEGRLGELWGIRAQPLLRAAAIFADRLGEAAAGSGPQAKPADGKELRGTVES